MRRWVSSILVALVVLTSVPDTVHAGGRGGVVGAGRSHVVRVGAARGHVVVRPRPLIPAPSVFPHPIDPWRFWPPSVLARPFHRPFAGFGGVPLVGFGSGFYTSGLVTGSAPLAYPGPDPSASVVIEPPAPQPIMPTVVEYQNGFYELRGDGTTVAYRWIWIPKPPPPPAAEAPAPSPPPPAPAERRTGPRSQIYHWTDDSGVTIWTDRLDRIPERYRAQAKANALSTQR